MINLFTCGLFFVLGVLSWPYLREFGPVERFKNYIKSFGLFKGAKVSREEVRSQLFFHDLINQIHGLGLFFSHKIHGKKVTTVRETELVLKELDVLQALIAHHFKYNHRNLNPQRELVSLEELKEGLYSILESYFPDHRWEVNFSGKLASSYTTAFNLKVHRPTFYRIMTNIIKNIQEENSQKVKIDFDYKNNGLLIVVKNSVEKNIHEEKEYQQTFPWEKNTDSGMGLVSINFLAQELGGSCRFYIENSMWITQVFLPASVEQSVRLENQRLAS